MITQTFARASAPHIETLADAIRPQMQGRSFYLRHENGAVVVECEDFTGVTLANIQAQVDACAADTPIVAAKYAIDNDTGTFTMILRALALVIMDELNIVRQAPSTTFAARTAGQIKTALKNKLDTF